MDLYQGLLLITSIHLLAAATPGPDFVLVSQQTLSNGKRAGLLCSLGIALGLSVHILYSSLGLAAIIASSSSALWGIKILGGGYLIYLGLSGLKTRARRAETSHYRSCPRTVRAKNHWTGIFMQCTQPQSPHLLCITVYNRFISRHPCSASIDLWSVDDGTATSLVLFAEPAIIKAEHHPEISTYGSLD